jgi:hypothetical protein
MDLDRQYLLAFRNRFLASQGVPWTLCALVAAMDSNRYVLKYLCQQVRTLRCRGVYDDQSNLNGCDPS